MGVVVDGGRSVHGLETRVCSDLVRPLESPACLLTLYRRELEDAHYAGLLTMVDLIHLHP
jgi:hypothetical protein